LEARRGELNQSDLSARADRPNRLSIQADFQTSRIPDQQTHFFRGFDQLGFVSLKRVGENQLLPELKGAKVHVFGVGRSGTADRAALPIERLNKILEFWNTLFRDGGSESVDINQNLAVQSN
jgi:hypothetical protein